MNIATLFHAARFKDESQGQYRDRQKQQKAHLKRVSFAHISARILSLPPKYVDEDVDATIAQGRIRKIQNAGRFDAKGRMLRIGVEKGTTFTRPGGRVAYRAAVRAARRAA